MKTFFFSIAMILMVMQGCTAYTPFYGLTNQTTTCSDGERRVVLDCNALFGQTAPTSDKAVRLSISINEAGGGVGAESARREQFDSRTADQFNNIIQLCIHWNNCLISKSYYLAQMEFIRKEQFKIRLHNSEDSYFSMDVDMNMGTPGFVEPQDPLNYEVE